ncbi:hypothetical protein LTR37_001264 [Vermiconidia calcicola]|uniref:Uncharacterized protein n=1 Tax=Vermiconidia calcicola TaxID=1690605 RepID=A0ACC3NX17_9PEZI|nr:hypothetical protein LTR37_001264 [Vermiconidia calcicola]
MPGRQPVEEEKTNIKKSKGVVPENEKAFKIELKYLTDTFKLAEHVQYTLRCEKPEKALDLCRLASKKQEVIVSWNHCIDWHIQRGKVDDAMKIYNEMKKRAQFPDSYTYVLLLRGLAKAQHWARHVKESNVVKAVSIYNSMSSPTSRVKPSIMHANAVLKVCSQALDLDAMWGVVNQLPAHGGGAPDHMTYAILLHAIRHGAFGRDPDNVDAAQISARRMKAVQEGRAIWRDVIAKWRGGEIQIDEELVCAMGRLLLMSNRLQDWDDVLNLIQQTMNVTRLVPPLGDANRRIEHVPQEDDGRLPEAESEEDSEGYKDSPSTKAFLPVHPHRRDSAYPDRPTSLAWCTPGNPTLSLLIGACTLLRIPKTAVSYWDLLTSPSGPHKLQPDIANFHAQLRLFSRNRASAKALALLRDAMPAAHITPTKHTFRIAMATCMRDKKNNSVLEHATGIINLMEKTLADPDAKTLINYLDLAVYTDSGPKITATLDRLDPIVHNLRSRVTYGADDTGISLKDHADEKQEILHFFRTMVGVIDTLRFRGLVPRESFPHWHGRRAQLDSFIGRAKLNLTKREPVGVDDPFEEDLGRKIRKFETKGERWVTGREERALRVMRAKKWREAEERAGKGEEGTGPIRPREPGMRRKEGRRREGFADSAMELGEL